MNKILNWTFGACFRTLGRFLAIFIVGISLIFIGSKIGIELPDWLALTVNATQSPGWASELPAVGRVEYKSCSGANTCSTKFESYVDYFETTHALRSFVINEDAMTIGNNGYVISTPTGTLKQGYLYQIDYYICSNVDLSKSNYTPLIYTANYSSSVNPPNTYNLTARMALSGSPIIDTDRDFNYCYRYSGLVVPELDYAWTMFRITSSSVTNNVYLSTISSDVRELGIYTDTLESVIKNSGFATADSVDKVQESVDKVEDEIKQTQDTITNDDTSGAEGSANGFFNDFKSEDFGLSSIVTAPLRGINAMLTDTCIAPSATYKGQTFSLPCGSMLWSRPGGEDFKSFINVMYGGFLAYLVIRKFFLDVETLKNPNSDKVEVDKL